MTQAVTNRLHTAGNRVRSHVNPCETDGRQIRTGKGFSRIFRVFPVCIITTYNHAPWITFVYTLLFPERQTGEEWEPSKIKEHWTQKHFHFLRSFYPKQSTSLRRIFFTSQTLTLFLAYLYQKDNRAPWAPHRSTKLLCFSNNNNNNNNMTKECGDHRLISTFALMNYQHTQTFRIKLQWACTTSLQMHHTLRLLSCRMAQCAGSRHSVGGMRKHICEGVA
jgi:hypothetical protein